MEVFDFENMKPRSSFLINRGQMTKKKELMQSLKVERILSQKLSHRIGEPLNRESDQKIQVCCCYYEQRFAQQIPYICSI